MPITPKELERRLNTANEFWKASNSQLNELSEQYGVDRTLLLYVADAFNDLDKAISWLETPNIEFDGRTALSVLVSGDPKRVIDILSKLFPDWPVPPAYGGKP